MIGKSARYGDLSTTDTSKHVCLSVSHKFSLHHANFHRHQMILIVGRMKESVLVIGGKTLVSK